MYQALYRKYRPSTFSDVVSQEHITDILKNQIKSDRVSHAYIFTGTRGTGKTSCAKILAKAVNCQNPQEGDPCNSCESCISITQERAMDTLEIDAASNNKVDDIRAVLEETRYTPAVLKKRVFIIDEVHMLTTQAFNALLKTLEEPPSHVLFILATTEIHKVLPTILSRCQRFDFKRISPNAIEKRLHDVVQSEGITLTAEAGKIIAKLAEGGLRDALSILDRCIAINQPTITADIVCSLVGNITYTGLISLAKSIMSLNTTEAISIIDALYNDGIELTVLLKQLMELFRDILISKVTSDYDIALMYGLSKEEFQSLFVSTETLERYMREIAKTLLVLQKSASKKIDVEICIISLCKPLDTSDIPIEKRMAQLEDKITNYKPQVIHAPKEAPVSTQPVVLISEKKLDTLEIAGLSNDQLSDKLLETLQNHGVSRSVLGMLKKTKLFFDGKCIQIVIDTQNIYDNLLQKKIELDKVIHTIFTESVTTELINSINKNLIQKNNNDKSIDTIFKCALEASVEISQED